MRTMRFSLPPMRDDHGRPTRFAVAALIVAGPLCGGCAGAAIGLYVLPPLTRALITLL